MAKEPTSGPLGSRKGHSGGWFPSRDTGTPLARGKSTASGFQAWGRITARILFGDRRDT